MSDWPRHWEEYAWLASAAQLLLTERRNRYPDLVRRNKLSNLQAAEGLRLMQAIADEWQAIADLRPEPADAWKIWRGDKAATLLISRALYANRMTKHPREPRYAGMFEAIDTLLWHYQRKRYGPLFPREAADKAIAGAAADHREAA